MVLEDITAGILHLVLLTTQTDDTATLDHAMRGTYQLALAAAEAGVERIRAGQHCILC